MIKLRKGEVSSQQRNHPLKNANGINDIHITPNVVLLYRYDTNGYLVVTLELYDIVDHDELLNNQKKKDKFGDKTLVPYDEDLKESKKKKEEDNISYEGLPEVAMNFFNNSTSMGPAFSDSGGCSVGEALRQLNDLEEDSFTRNYRYNGPIYVGYDTDHIDMTTTAYSPQQALNNIKYRYANGDKITLARITLDPNYLREVGMNSRPTKKEVKKNDDDWEQLSMFSMNED